MVPLNYCSLQESEGRAVSAKNFMASQLLFLPALQRGAISTKNNGKGCLTALSLELPIQRLAKIYLTHDIIVTGKSLISKPQKF